MKEQANENTANNTEVKRNREGTEKRERARERKMIGATNAYYKLTEYSNRSTTTNVWRTRRWKRRTVRETDCIEVRTTT